MHTLLAIFWFCYPIFVYTIVIPITVNFTNKKIDKGIPGFITILFIVSIFASVFLLIDEEQFRNYFAVGFIIAIISGIISSYFYLRKAIKEEKNKPKNAST